MRVSLIGAGDKKFHFGELLGFSEEEVNSHIDSIAKALVELGVELTFLPDRGICFDVCKKYKELGGRKVIATVPKDDKEFGINHLALYLDAKVNGKKIVDEIINSGTWYKENTSHNLFGDKVLLLGLSLGSLGELAFGYYLFKLFKGYKKDVNVSLKKINSNFFAGENFSFDTLVYSPFVKEKVPFEIEKYIEKFNSKLFYISNVDELKKQLS